MPNMSIAPNMVNWIIEHSRIEERNSSMFHKMQKWKTGEKTPTFNQIEEASKATNIPLGYFFLDEPPVEELPILEYRTINSYYSDNPSRNLIDTINSMESIQDWMREYLIESDESKLDFVGSMKQVTDVKEIARSIRKTLQLPINWYENCENSDTSFKMIRKRLECSRVIVMMNGIVDQNTHRKLDVEEFRAFTIIDDYAPLIFINTNDSKNGKLFSLLHEVSHIWMGENDFFNDRYGRETNVRENEKICNAVAAEIIAPLEKFNDYWLSANEREVQKKILSLSSFFKCGTTVIARRALDSGFINQETYQMIADEAIKHYIESEDRNHSSSGGNYYNTARSRIDNRFILALDCSVREGKTQYTEAYRLTKTNRKTFSKLVDQVRGTTIE